MNRLPGFVAVLTVSILMVALAGCTAPGEKVQMAPLTEAASAEYRQAVEDGVITEEEYTAGYRRFIACIGDKGWEIDDRGRPSTVYEYGIPEDAHLNGDFDECWNKEFKEIEIIWRTTNPPTTALTPMYIACLEAAGLPTDGNELELQTRLSENGIDLQECIENPPNG